MTTLDYNYLDQVSDKIETTLDAVGAPVWVMGGRIAPQYAEFLCLPRLGTTFAAIQIRAQDIGLGVGKHGIRVAQSGRHVAIQVPIADRRTIKLSNLLPSLSKPHTAILGVDDKGLPLQVRLPAPTVSHILISGTTGSGKTELIKTMLASLTKKAKPRELGFIIIDPKRRNDTRFERLISTHLLRPPAVDIASIINILRTVVSLVDTRTVDDPNNARVVVYVDEMADICQAGGVEVINLLTRIVARGREADVHLIAATQKPSSRAIDPVMKANFPFRIAMRVMSSQDALVATGISGSGAEHLLGNGDAIACFAGDSCRFQAALCDLVPPDDAIALPAEVSKPVYVVADPLNVLQGQIADLLNRHPGISSIRALQGHLTTISGKSYSGGAAYWKQVEAAAAVGFSPAVDALKRKQQEEKA